MRLGRAVRLRPCPAARPASRTAGRPSSGRGRRVRLGAALGEAGGQFFAQAFQAVVAAGHFQQRIAFQREGHDIAAECVVGVLGPLVQALQTRQPRPTPITTTTKS